jgi:hypothetical protein
VRGKAWRWSLSRPFYYQPVSRCCKRITCLQYSCDTPYFYACLLSWRYVP